MVPIRERMPQMHQNYEQKILFGESADASAKRMAAVKLMLGQNIELLAIAGVVGVSERQVYNYKRQIKAGGDIYKDRHYRPVSDMAAVDAQIVNSLKEEPVATTREAAKRIEEITGIKRGNTQVRKFMRDHGFKPLKTASLPAKMDPAAQRKFLEEELEPRLARAKGENNKSRNAATEKPMETETFTAAASSDIKTADSLHIIEKPEGMGSGLIETEAADTCSDLSIDEGKGTIDITSVEPPNKQQGSVVLFMDAVHCV
jgi:transposase